MRNAILLGGVGLLGIILLLASATTASQADLVATSGIPTKLQGNLDASAGRSTLVATGSSWDASFLYEGASLERVRVTSSYSRLPVADVGGERRVETQPLQIQDGVLRVQPVDATAAIAARSTTATLRSLRPYATSPADDFWSSANAQLSVLIVDERVGPPMANAKLAQVGDQQAPEALLAQGLYKLTADGQAQARATEILLHAARILAADGTVLAEGSRYVVEKPGGAYLPSSPTGEKWVGPGTHVEETVEYFVIRSGGVALTLAGPISLHAEDLRVRHTGFIGFPWAEGSLRTANETIGLSGDQVILGGDLRLRPISYDLTQAPQLTLLGDGDVQYVQIGKASRSVGHTQAALAAGGAVAGVGLLALLAYFWPAVKYGASIVLFPLYARVPKENTLDHKGRELLYDLIKNEPGVSTNKLAREVPFGWSTLTYHLRVLERNEAIVSVRDGRYKRFFDRQSGRFANGRKYILAVLKNEATYGIASFIREKPGASQKEVATSFQLSPSSVHWHVERLSEVGLVSKMREAHNVKYFPGDAWDHVTIEDLKALEAAGPEPSEDFAGVEEKPAVAAATASPPQAQSPSAP